MIFDDQIYPFLSGEQLSSGLTVDLSKTKYPPHSRNDRILNISKGKSVIHIGCSDHLEIIDMKIKENRWLHKLLTDHCEPCFGIDLNEESIEYLKTELGYKNVKSGDILLDDFEEIKQRKWDYAIFGEIVEHLDNPVEFLSTFREKYKGDVERFIITVPNVFNKYTIRQMNSYREQVNSDHRFWFTPYTISKVIYESGLIPERIDYGNRIKLTTTELIKRKFLSTLKIPDKYPFMYFYSLIITGRLS